MTIRNLDALFQPKSIALVGASDTPASIGAVLANKLFAGGFKGPLMPVDPKHKTIAGRDVFPDVASLPQPVDLGVICTPATAVPGILEALGKQCARGAVVITAGFGERQEARGVELQDQLRNAAKSGQLRVVGPNCLGLLVPRSGLNASSAHKTPANGVLAFVAQSGAIVTSVLGLVFSVCLAAAQSVGGENRHGPARQPALSGDQGHCSARGTWFHGVLRVAWPNHYAQSPNPRR